MTKRSLFLTLILIVSAVFVPQLLAEDAACNSGYAAEIAEVDSLGLPIAPIMLESNLYPTCIECSSHEQCQSVCGGTELYFDYVCMWTYDVCGPELHIRQCSCN